ncbi:putative anti-sigma regulatory factor, serine/threonine protein kinase [Candidatus Methanoperedens nitroreducens]|uniref:Putative anti-sigma regulatory factor, serine/threonine protein kinase n=2 Tax=Candidatus Methanoperedens nitratireducens TaxID=1392998 RepID=A0A284VRY5_9EURY|nr:putative anti-sigma regulatory factor, serine/threonine protein kinase [Candidatus Methanoperedens nitroreducens]
MVMKEERIIVTFETDVLRARRAGREMAHSLGFDEIGAGEIETAISELATNLIKHAAKYGEIILIPLNDEGRTGIEVRSEDKGRGIKNIEMAMKEGGSTAGTLGIGLSGVKRLMDEFSIESQAGKGTTVVARKWLLKDASQGMKFSVFARPRIGEDVSGDAYFIKRFSSYVIFSVIDVLGHGRDAHDVALSVLKILEDNYTEPLAKIIDICHTGLRHTRGAAMALCRVNFKLKKFEHVGIGNVETRVFGATEPVEPFFFNGTLGMAMENYRVIEYPYIEGMAIVLFSDGISRRFDLSQQMLTKTPQEIAKFIFDNYARDTDDATVLVAK